MMLHFSIFNIFCLYVMCIFSVSSFVLKVDCDSTLIGIFHSCNELYSWPNFGLGVASFGLAKLYSQINIFNIMAVI